MNMFSILIAFFLPHILAQCPKERDISPCRCTDDDGRSSLSCWGDLWLPRLSSILRKAMCGRSIDRFELMESNITYLPSNLFLRTAVKEINIYGLSVKRFGRGSRSAFYGLEDHLNSLSMRRCSLIDSLQWQMIGQLRALAYLDLSYNDLTGIPPQWFERPPPNLVSLVLKGNKISVLEAGALTFMHSLVELDLSENRISSFVRSALPKPGNALIFLRLSYNRLENVPKDFFDEMMGLKRIYLDNNNIRRLEQSTWRSCWADLDTLDLNGNELLCDCSAAWVSASRSPKRLYGQCAGSNLTGVDLKMLQMDHFEQCFEEI